MSNINDNAVSSESQNRRIAAWLEQGNSLTQMEALNMFQCFRLASRINDLRKRGLEIVTEKIITNTGKRVANYKMARA